MIEKVVVPIVRGAERVRAVGKNMLGAFDAEPPVTQLDQDRQEQAALYLDMNSAVARIQARNILTGEPNEDARLAFKTTMAEHLPTHFHLGSIGLTDVEVEGLRSHLGYEVAVSSPIMSGLSAK